MVEKRTVIIYPHLGDRAGTGHIKRVLPFLTDIRFNAYILHNDINYACKIIEKFGIDPERVIDLKDIDRYRKNIDFVVLDNRESDRYLYDKLADIAPVIAIDEGGFARSYASYLIDILPNLTITKPNHFNPGLLNLPDKQRESPGRKKILVTFGGQDPYFLTGRVVDSLKESFDLTTVIGPLFKTRDFGVKKIDNPESLKDILHKYDLVITSFGLTAYEAISSNVPVALYNPTEYHEKLGRKAGFYLLNDKLKLNFRKAERSIKSVDTGYKENLTDFIYNLEPSMEGCPVCGRKRNHVNNRFIDKTYLKCKNCSIDYMLSFKPQREYTNDYFESEYESQYGKTYLEDFEYIKSMGESRLNWILKRSPKGSSVLDIGCAYGPFLAAAKDKGFEPYGIDVSEGGVRYINEELGFKAEVTPFPLSDTLSFPQPFRTVTMWYVIEHFKDLDKVLTQVNTLLEKGGVFAFSTPNISGISGRKSLYNFEKNSPDDHYSILSPKSAAKVLKQYGFKVYKINVTGHHPERFGKWVKGSFLKRALLFISKLFKLGDTFELYSVKEKDL